MKRTYSIIAFGEPLTEVLLDQTPRQQEIKDQKQMSNLLRYSTFNAVSGDVVNFIGNYTVLKKLLSREFALKPETVGLITETGADEFGKKIKKTLNKLSSPSAVINTNLISLIQREKSGIYGIRVLDNKGNYKFYFDRFGYAFENALRKSTLEKFIKICSQAYYFYTTGIALMMSKNYSLFPILFERLQKQGTRIVFDTNFRKTVACHANIPDIHQLLLKIYSKVNIMLAGEEDIRFLYPNLASLSTEKLVNEFYCFWDKENLSKKRLIIKCGANGVYWFDNKLNHIPIVINDLKKCENNILHPEGAGDAFNAGYILARYYGKNINACIKFGCMTASLLVRVQGCFRDMLPFNNSKTALINSFRPCIPT
ncbi:MAG: hypothetical protein UX17_C0038G0006 [Parcubacteria group bacterium GW2011_GWC2_45_7]|uniref:Carbohydrate kinase PfkB domain-containing protein n=1 Tax=Candidatus Roizmanbacteria bacterium GW2011_GWA2_36_23 TaxID=1618480 RepID=A0A0G0E445_9BACT|nr:MAG: hypothetical protein US11_C0005G0019 [Candidatus Roizmanbacteria bacterium GW2011_GWA2_36_23]KKU12767.1 MAG: hypothetical protein UX17_C0038G0006 [Parcubacteria group bacterium GW2011_GWC2_45_7]